MGKGGKKVDHVINRIFHQHFENIQWQPYSLDISSPGINLDRRQTFLFFCDSYLSTHSRVYQVATAKSYEYDSMLKIKSQ